MPRRRSGPCSACRFKSRAETTFRYSTCDHEARLWLESYLVQIMARLQGQMPLAADTRLPAGSHIMGGRYSYCNCPPDLDEDLII